MSVGFGVAGVGPMFSQVHLEHFHYPPKKPYILATSLWAPILPSPSGHSHTVRVPL